METMHKYSVGQLFDFTPNSYLERTSRPVYAIFFLLPFILFYELGTILINTDVLNNSQIRVVAFVWMQNFLQYIGLTSKLAWAAPPLAVIIILIAMQFTSRKKWTLIPGDFWPMAIESIVLAVPLIVFSLFLNSAIAHQNDFAGGEAMQANSVTICASTAEQPAEQEQNGIDEPVMGKSVLADIVTGIGAGIYEELVFRLILICLLMMLFQDILRFDNRNAIICSVLISAALFSAHHHIGFFDGRVGIVVPFNWPQFGFRVIAGVYFAALFAIRGFAVTAGTHGFYDIMVVLVNVVFFQR